jgi:O-methyltransferase
MDFTVYPETPISRLPRALRPPALLLRNLVTPFISWRQGNPTPEARPAYVYEADGLATVHFSPFLYDTGFAGRYSEMASNWFVGANADVRWRMWILVAFARECSGLTGSVCEFGVYRAGCAFMMLSTAAVPENKRLFLFDTFSGFPREQLTDAEITTGLVGALADTSVEYVAQLLSRWQEQIEIVAGDVFQTLDEVETGPLSFVHVDLNASAPTLRALEYAYPRLVSGAIMVFDDYGEKGLEDQREVVDAFFATREESVIALPTRQGILVKR